MIQYRASLRAEGKRIAVVASRFNELVVEGLIKGCEDTLLQHGVKDADIFLVRVPGAFEIPLICKEIAVVRDVQAIVALGAVIRGDTPHFDYVASQSAVGLLNVALEHRLPVANGILTTETLEQALERAGSKAGNKGRDAALTAIEMISLSEYIRSAGN